MPPTELINQIQAVRTKLRLFSVAFGVGLLLAGAVVLLLALVGLDYLLNLPVAPRVVLLLSTIALLGYGLWRWVLHPAGAKITLSDIAGRLEQVFPQFDDRLRSTVNFHLGDSIPGSEAMKSRVIEEAGRIAQQTNFSSVLQSRPMWMSLAGALVAMGLLLGAASLAGKDLRTIALQRLFNPLSTARWPRTVEINLLSAVPAKIAAGQELPIKIHLTRGDRASRRPLVLYSVDDGPEQSEYMTRQNDGSFTSGIRPRAASESGGALKVRIVAGDDEQNLEPIRIVPMLALKSVQAMITAPAYTQQKPTTIDLVQGGAMAVVGSQVSIRAVFSKPLDAKKSIELISSRADSILPSVQWEPADLQSVNGQYVARESMRFRIRATDTDGLSNAGIEEFEILVRPDQTPAVVIENPRRNEERTPQAVIPLRILCEDDFGIQSLALRINRLGDKKHWDIDLVKDSAVQGDATFSPMDSSNDRRRFAAGLSWDLARLAEANLQPGDVLEYFAEATDSYRDGTVTHAPVQSGKLRITIISQDEFRARVTEELRIAAYQIGEIDKSQTRTRQETENLKKDTLQKPIVDTADKAVAERLSSRQSTSAAQTKALAGRMENVLQAIRENKSNADDLKATAQDVADILDKTAEEPMKQATANLNEFRQAAPQSERNAKLDESIKQQNQASEQLHKAADRLGNLGTLSQAIDNIRNLLAQQQQVSAQTNEIGKRNLGKMPEQMSAEDRKRLEQAAKEQSELAKKTDKAINDLAKQADQLQKSSPTDSEAMKQAAATGKSQQVPQNQSKASSAVQKNQQSSAQAAQKQAEIGLEMILNDLREAERRKLEELAKRLEQIQKQLAMLIRRQAGHNLDDLSLQGADALARLDAKDRDALLAKAERTPADQTTPTIPQLSTGQEQTERNTRDLSDSTDMVPRGSEASTQLTRAAERMQRAIVFLRDAKPKDAYNPPMIDALAALEQAARVIDEEKKKADQKLEEQQKESIRAVYQRVREEQAKLNTDTTRIDASPRAQDGSLKREDGVRLGQLPGEQGKLHDELKKLDEALSSLRSIVYTWANRDLVKAMAGVKDALAKPDTGKLTQAEQSRILRQLDSLIANLSIKPLKEDFEQKESGGGGGGGGGPPPARIPSESELRMLKDLQLGVNEGTKQASAVAKKDEPMLLGLGNRQGDLRNLLGQLMEQASRGKLKLRDEPDNKDQLPEEASKEDIEDQELANELLKEKPDAEKVERDALLVGDRMARSRQRLAINHDPGKVTQIIQEKIIKDLDLLIEQARKNGAQGSPKPSSGQPSQAKNADPNKNAQPNSKNATGAPQPSGATPAAQSNTGAPNARTPELSKELAERASEWGGLTPRQRAAILEGASENIVEKYRKLIDDYYRTLATKSTERR